MPLKLGETIRQLTDLASSFQQQADWRLYHAAFFRNEPDEIDRDEIWDALGLLDGGLPHFTVWEQKPPPDVAPEYRYRVGRFFGTDETFASYDRMRKLAEQLTGETLEFLELYLDFDEGWLPLVYFLAESAVDLRLRTVRFAKIIRTSDHVTERFWGSGLRTDLFSSSAVALWSIARFLQRIVSEGSGDAALTPSGREIRHRPLDWPAEWLEGPVLNWTELAKCMDDGHDRRSIHRADYIWRPDWTTGTVFMALFGSGKQTQRWKAWCKTEPMLRSIRERLLKARQARKQKKQS